MQITSKHVAFAAGRAVVYGAFSLVDPNRLQGWRKHAFWAGLAAVAAVEGAVVTRQGREDWVSPSETVGVGALSAGVTYGGQELWAKADAWFMDVLQAAGVRQPRLWYAGANALTGAAMTFFDAWTPGEEDDEDELGEAEPIDDHLRGIVRGLLNGITGYGAEELFAQLATARARSSEGLWEFEVDEDAPRTVIRDYAFPVVGTFTRGGTEHLVQLDVYDGQLGSLAIYADEFDPGRDADFSLPRVDEVDFHLEQADA
ncbi:MAG: hypothetical protein Q4F65_06395 [Propionibacteriaceae bacterium]|nr:hypothetical protein [Propionibacteriaceae bacterium]